MSKLDLEQIVKDMGKAALPLLRDGAQQAKEYGKSEAEKLARTAALLAAGIKKGSIDADEAKLVLDVQKNASRAILLTISGLGIVAVENAINAALAVLKKAVATATGVAL